MTVTLPRINSEVSVREATLDYALDCYLVCLLDEYYKSGLDVQTAAHRVAEIVGFKTIKAIRRIAQ